MSVLWRVSKASVRPDLELKVALLERRFTLRLSQEDFEGERQGRWLVSATQHLDHGSVPLLHLAKQTPEDAMEHFLGEYGRILDEEMARHETEDQWPIIYLGATFCRDLAFFDIPEDAEAPTSGRSAPERFLDFIWNLSDHLGHHKVSPVFPEMLQQWVTSRDKANHLATDSSPASNPSSTSSPSTSVEE